MANYILSITEVNGDYEYPTKVLFTSNPECSDKTAELITLNFRGGSEGFEEDSMFAFNHDGSTGIKYNKIDQVSDVEYEVLRKYITEITLDMVASSISLDYTN